MKTKALLMILEDDEAQVFALKGVLKTTVPEVDFRMALHGRQFFEVISSEQILPDIAILDINTPVMDGFEVLQKMRSDRSYDYLPIVMFSTSDAYEDKRKAEMLGADGYVQKPPRAEFGKVINEIIQKYVGSRSQFPRPSVLTPFSDARGGVQKTDPFGDIDSLMDEI
jgi:DNA-binding response OmpR family regulator